MRVLPEVQQAKELMSEAMDWSTFKWLFEKHRVRATADRANDALDRLNRSVKARWNEEAKAFYKRLAPRAEGPGRKSLPDPPSPDAPRPPLWLLIEKVVEADHAARCARRDAEETFDEAEKQLSIPLARRGCKKAIRSWDLHEKAIRKAESAAEFCREQD